MSQTTFLPPEPGSSKEWTDPITKEVFEVRHCHTDELGHYWWEFVEPLRMPAMRGVDGECAAEWARLHITGEDLLNYLDEMEALGNKGLIGRMFGLFAALRARVKAQMDKKALVELAKVYYLVDDEPVGAPTVHHNALKEEIWAKDTICAAFFLGKAFALTTGYSEYSGADILTFFHHQELAKLTTPQPPKPEEGKPTSSSTRGQRFLDNVRKSTRRRGS